VRAHEILGENMLVKNLHYLLEDAVRQARSVELYFRGKVNHHLVSGSVLMVGGDVQHFALGQHSGRTALQYLPQVELTMAVALPLEKTPPDKDRNTPDAPEILRQLKAMILGLQSIEPEPSFENLSENVEYLVRTTLGAQAIGQLTQITHQISPSHSPNAFLRASMELFTPTIGQAATEQMFQPLLDRYPTGSRTPTIPEISAPKNPSSEKNLGSLFLYSQVEDILQSVFGSGASVQLTRIAKQFPPRENPVEFLLECKRLLEPMIGEAAAKKMLEHLYKTI
jgi:hypothetical protein